VDQRFGEVERSVIEEETSSHTSIADLRKVEGYLKQQIPKSKGKEAAVDNELKYIETYLDEDHVKRKKFQQDLEDKGKKINKIEEFYTHTRAGKVI